MADTYEKDLAQKSSLTTSDYIRVVGSDNVSYKQLVSSVANATGSAYLGAFSASSDEDAVKQALSALKTKYSSESSSTENLPKVVSFMRSGAWGFVGIAWIRSTTVEMTAVRYTDGATYFGKDVSGTQTVTAQPTRAEVNALTAKTSVSVTASTNVVIDVNNSYKLGKTLFLNVKGHTTANIANAYLLTFSGASPDPYNFTFGIPIGSGAWAIDGIAYGYINQGAVTATIQSGKYFHIAQAFICS